MITFHLKSQIRFLTCRLRSYGRIVGLVFSKLLNIRLKQTLTFLTALQLSSTYDDSIYSSPGSRLLRMALAGIAWLLPILHVL